MSATPEAPVDENGDAELGPRATLYHKKLGALTRVSDRGDARRVRFRVENVKPPYGRRVTIEYDAPRLAEAWEDVLFENPEHAEDVLGGGRDG
jgi:hypothetical protein